MKIYDIAQEVFGCAVFPGDSSPDRKILSNISDVVICNLTELKMCAHNGTHVDAPYHFLDEGKTIDQVDLKRFVGYAYVAGHEGILKAEDAELILKNAREASDKSDLTDCDAYNRILIKGDAEMSEEAARVFADNNILLFGNESQTVGPLDAPMAVHLIMLGAEIVLLEGIRLGEVEEGVYMLNAAPLNLGGADGAPCRAILIK